MLGSGLPSFPAQPSLLGHVDLWGKQAEDSKAATTRWELIDVRRGHVEYHPLYLGVPQRNLGVCTH